MPPIVLENPAAEAPAKPASGPVLRFPLSSAQQRCRFVNALDPGTTALNVALRWELRGRFDALLVERAFGHVIARHEALRTRIVEHDGDGEQEVHPPFRLIVDEVDLSALSESRRDADVRRLGRAEAHKPFDIGQLPLLRVTLLRLAPDRAMVLLTVHQIVFDGWSIRLISADFGAAVAALNAGIRPDLPELPLQYGDYAAWQHACLSGGRFDREAAYWKQQLDGLRYFEVRGDRPRGERPSSNGEILAELLPETLAGAMDRRVKAAGVTTFAFGCAVVAALLHRITGATEVTFGTQIAGRNDPDLEGLIGVFINNLVLRLDLSGDPTFRDVIGRANRTIQDALIHQSMPFHRLVELLRPPRDPSRMPLISVNFTVLQDVMENARYGDVELIGHPSLSAGSLYDLNFFMVHWPTGWRIALEYNTDLFDRSTGETLLGSWRDGLARAVHEPHSTLAALFPTACPRVPNGPARTRSSTTTRSPPGVPRDASTKGTTQTERTVMRIWQDVLGLETIDPEADFFESGGHSLVALRMLARVREAFGCKVTVATLFAAPTARAFSRLVDAPARDDAWQIMPIQPRGTKTPVIVINNTVLYHELAKALGPDRPVLAVQLFDPHEGSEPSDASFEALCKRYEALVRSARARGPYVLMGLCVAGCIAYEVARRLRDAGEDVPMVVMADSWRPGFLAGLPPLRAAVFRLSYRWHVGRHHLRSLRAGRTTVLAVLHSYPRIRGSGVFRWLRARTARADDALGKEDWANRWFLPALERLRDRHVVAPFAGTVVLLQSEEAAIPFGDARMGWAPFARGRLLRRRVAGWHAEMFEGPSATAIADFLHPLLAEVDEEDPAAAARRRDG